MRVGGRSITLKAQGLAPSERWKGLLLLATLAACAGGLVSETDSGAPEDASIDKSTADVPTLPLDGGIDGITDVGIDTFDAGCVDAGLGGVGLPSGTTASATTTYSNETPDLAVDGDVGTYWNAGAATGSLTITFSSPQAFIGVNIEGIASPTSTETYQITGYQNASPTVIGSSTQTVPQGATALATIDVTPGTYDSIQIDVSSSQSWVAIGGVSLVTPYCP